MIDDSESDYLNYFEEVEFAACTLEKASELGNILVVGLIEMGKNYFSFLKIKSILIQFLTFLTQFFVL